MTKPIEAYEALKKYREDYPDVVPPRTVVEAHYFEPSGTFDAIDKARELVAEKGYTYGSMQREAPIAIAKGFSYISKWYNLGEDIAKIEGVIIPAPDFREGGAAVIIFEGE